MKNLTRRFCNCHLIEKENSFSVIGRCLHWSIFVILGIWIFLSLMFIADLKWADFLLTSFLTLVLITFLAFAFKIEIRINKSHVLVMLRLWFIPLYFIRTRTEKLIINDSQINDIKIISQRKDYYKEDIKNNLRFSYIMPMDGNQFTFYIDYKNRQRPSFYVCCDDFFWKSIIKGLRNLDTKTTTNRVDGSARVN